ncbi:SdpI family protein [Frigoribacterium sp. UYMn621]|jgi:uncharacterized membrane protein|uniref:SdpI family protein n=1 Tax=Frigoribacterium sp. UYMn621 TaxID=3156343 RepID=UPI00339A508B
MFIASITVAALALIIVGITIGCARGLIPVNSLAGIRLRSVMINDSTWRAGHRAAVPAELIGGAATVVVALSALVVRSADAAQLLSIGATVILLGSTVVAGFLANRAALTELGAEQDAEQGTG